MANLCGKSDACFFTAVCRVWVLYVSQHKLNPERFNLESPWTDKNKNKTKQRLESVNSLQKFMIKLTLY